MNDDQEEQQCYQFLVVDSGPIIRLTGISTLWKKARAFYTVPAVLQEIRDAKARQHLESLPFPLQTKTPSPEAMQAIVDFSRQTGDYQSLSSVDLQILALAYDLEKEACGGDMSHIRTTPKRVVGIGKVEALTKNDEEKKERDEDASVESDQDSVSEDEEEPVQAQASQVTPQGVAPANATSSSANANAAASPSKPRSWAALVNPSAASVSPVVSTIESTTPNLADQAMTLKFGSMSIANTTNKSISGQFSDAEESETKEDDGHEETEEDELQKELASDFPSLAAAAHVPYDGSDDEVEELDEELRKKQALAPISKSGKLYNTLGKYKKLLKPSAPETKTSPSAKETDVDVPCTDPNAHLHEDVTKSTQSRILGGGVIGGQEAEFEDDGEGWISTVSEIKKMKSMGVLDPKSNPECGDGVPKEPQGPPISQRAACTTTDFAMQNVLLQMNMELLSVDGMKVRKLKSWVQRCGACFKVYTNAENTGPVAGKRLFCDHCGSSMIQRIACSVDSKTGRLRLHLSKKYKHNLRGTKYSLPKPGTNNRFQGDLVLAEDQLMMGAWNQKVKIRSGGKAKASAQSMFGLDIASNVGCNARSMTEDDIRVGFGRRNPNAVKGRERRGKKKKSGDKACGLRRY